MCTQQQQQQKIGRNGRNYIKHHSQLFVPTAPSKGAQADRKKYLLYIQNFIKSFIGTNNKQNRVNMKQNKQLCSKWIKR